MSSKRWKITGKRKKVAKKRGKYKKCTTELRKEIVRLYQQQKLSCREVANNLSVSSSSVNRAVKAAGVARLKTDAQRAHYEKMKGKAKDMFRCKICGNTKPLSDFIENRRFRPPIYGCKECIYE